jgi:hypothetical protein
MASAITETDTYTATITAPDAGDAITAASVRTMGQGLANRSLHHETQLTAIEASIAAIQAEAIAMSSIAAYYPDGTAWAATSKLTLTEAYDRWGGFSHSAGDITVPAAGYYEITGLISTISSMFLETAIIQIRRATSPALYVAIKGNTADTGTVQAVTNASFSFLMYISDPATQKINFYNSAASGLDYVVGSAGEGDSYIIIRRVA